MKKSYYNFVFPRDDGKSILYNSRTGAMAELDKEHTELLEKLSEAELEKRAPNFANALLANGFAVEDGVSELDMIRYDMLRTRFGNQTLNITLAVTQDCNFGCKYCYEKNVIKNQYMDEETEKYIIDYVEKNLLEKKKLHVCWYGGEPLLALNIIQTLTAEFKRICLKKEAAYQADIITNGYLLTPSVAEILMDCEISQIQITMDGDMKTHNLRRPLIDGAPTYQVIWDNLLALKKYRKYLKVALRVNVDKENQRALDSVKKMIGEEKIEDFVYMYPGKVEEVLNCHNGESCYKNEEFAKLEQLFLCENKELLPRKYPHPRPFYCCADNGNAVIFDYQGDMYKCFMEIGKSECCVGNIRTNQLYHEEILHKYLLDDVTQRKECSICKYLPICMGGCPRKRLLGDESCSMYKYTMKKYMEYLPEVMKQ